MLHYNTMLRHCTRSFMPASAHTFALCCRLSQGLQFHTCQSLQEYTKPHRSGYNYPCFWNISTPGLLPGIWQSWLGSHSRPHPVTGCLQMLVGIMMDVIQAFHEGHCVVIGCSLPGAASNSMLQRRCSSILNTLMGVMPAVL
jgi:hypothetical protein